MHGRADMDDCFARGYRGVDRWCVFHVAEGIGCRSQFLQGGPLAFVAEERFYVGACFG